MNLITPGRSQRPIRGPGRPQRRRLERRATVAKPWGLVERGVSSGEDTAPATRDAERAVRLLQQQEARLRICGKLEAADGPVPIVSYKETAAELRALPARGKSFDSSPLMNESCLKE